MADGVKKINEWIMKDGRVIGITKNITATKFEPGTFFVNPQEGILKYNQVSSAGAKSWQKFLPAKIFDENTITRPLLVDSIINATKLENNAVIESKILNGAVTNLKLANNSVSTEKIKDLHVTTEKINNLAVTEYKLRNDAVTEAKIKDLAVTSSKISPLNVLNTHLANNTIRVDKLFDKTITNAKIADNTITEGLLVNKSVTENKIKELAIKAKHIDYNQVQTIHLLDRNVTGTKIATNSLKDEHMMLNSINANKLIDTSIVTSKLADRCVTNAKIADKSVDRDKLESTLKSLIDESIRVEGTNQTATVKGNLKVNGNIDATGNITGARVYNPVFADLAEAYIPTMNVEVGDAVCLLPCGNLLVEPLNKSNANLFLGFVSDQYASCYGGSAEELESGEKVAIALKGRIPVKMDTTKPDVKVGSFIGIENGEIVAYKQAVNYFYRPQTSIGRIIAVIDSNSAIVQI